MDSNPYAAPVAELDDRFIDAKKLERSKATRGQRLGAAILDGIFGMMCYAPYTYSVQDGGTVTPIAMTMVGVLTLALGITNLVLLYSNGQSLGKKIVGTKVVMADGSRAPLWRILLLRWLPLAIVAVIPLVNLVLAIVDACFIFGAERRCLHDLIAGTIVVDA
jgi:uncharacterized RDD family membrane protein YckC